MRLGLYVFLALLIFGLIAMHEITHYQILKYYGVDDENIYFFANWQMVGLYYEGECNDSCQLAHSINEVVGYNIMPFLVFICFILVVKEVR